MEKLSSLGEFGLIDKIAEKLKDEPDERIVKGIGDDCAVVLEGETNILLTTDMLVEGDHFDREWQTPWQIGWKSVIVNISDIAAMGGIPEWGLISVAFPEETTVPFADELMQGMVDASEEYGLKIIGGDTTHGDLLTINIAVTGKVDNDHLSLREDAESGDLICVSGDLGKSWAGLESLKAGKEGYTDFYLQPDCKLEVARTIAPHVNAMIDVSDGLASEVTHIADESGLGAEIEKDKIPISKETTRTGETLNKDPLQWALSGGEDFELVFTIPEERLDEIEEIEPIVVGKMTEEGRYLIDPDGKKERLQGGYDHFDR
ncbi:MAG: thiamine-phosphate kinase [Candidatus Thermoplasmatota archaeon]|nr:thiamine-phosphate kinase [Candidatus Thermoplasmatota archaeon]